MANEWVTFNEAERIPELKAKRRTKGGIWHWVKEGLVKTQDFDNGRKFLLRQDLLVANDLKRTINRKGTRRKVVPAPIAAKEVQLVSSTKAPKQLTLEEWLELGVSSKHITFRQAMELSRG